MYLILIRRHCGIDCKPIDTWEKSNIEKMLFRYVINSFSIILGTNRDSNLNGEEMDMIKLPKAVI